MKPSHFNAGHMGGLFSFFQPREYNSSERNTESPQPSPRPPARGAWHAGIFESYPIGDHLQAVRTKEGGTQVLPSFAVEFAYSCTEFRPLEAHVATYADRHGWDTLQVAALEDALPRLIQIGVLISTSQICDQVLQGADHSAFVPPTIEAIGFPTGGKRLPLLERALRSFVANAQAHGRTARYLVADSSTQEVDARSFRERLRELKRELGVEILYAGEPEKRRFVAALVRRSACSLQSAEFALLDPLNTGFTCGANRNALLLQEAGRPLCSVDDDVVCRLALPPGRIGNPELTCFSNRDPYSRWQFPDRESTWRDADWTERDFLGAHEALLGAPAARFFSGGADALDFSLAGEEFLRRTQQTGTQVRATFTGHVGDPGIPTSVYYLFFDRENRERLTQSEAHYRAAFGSRSVLTAFQNMAIGDASVSPGMAMGLDHRTLLPPFFPVLHAEDYIWGATLWQSCPDAWLGHVPLAIQHDTGPGKPILIPSDLTSERQVVLFEWAHLQRRLILGYHPPAGADASACTAGLGRYLSEMANVPAREFHELLAVEVLSHESEKLSWLEKQLDEATDAPEFWRDDVRAYLQHVREALTHEDFDIPLDLKARGTPPENRLFMQRMVSEFGSLLQEWPAMVEAARELRDAGEPLMEDVDL